MATHIIASSLPPKKTIDFNRYRIVKPAWIMDSIAASKLLPWSDYRVLDEGPRQKVLKLDGNNQLSQARFKVKKGYHEQTESSFYTSQLHNASNASKSGRASWSQLAERTTAPRHLSAQTLPGGFNPVHDQDSKKPAPNADISADKSTVNQSVTDAASRNAITPGGQGETSFRRLEPPKNATSEEHNAWLLSDPKMRKSSTANPEFLKQFYSESRLHHLSTWKAELKSKLQRTTAEKGVSGKPPPRKPGSRKYIMHVDFDSFFCAVSLKKHPEYTDKPVAVAHGTGQGSEIASCNYPARKFGVKNGMWMKRALEVCGELKVLPYDFPAYEDASQLFYESILEIGGTVQSVSVDEALVDVTSIVLSAAGSQGVSVDEGSIWREQEKADDIASHLREQVRERTGCNVSVGIGGNILQAKVALRRAKPAGQFQLKPDEVLDVIGQLKVEDLPGVAYSISGKLEEIGVKLVKDIRELSREKLLATLGPKTGEKLRDYARGIDRVEVGEMPPRKSVSAEVNWGIRFISQQEAEDFVYNLCKELERRLLNEQVRGKQLTMRIMRRSLDAPLDPAKHLGHGKCDMFSKSAPFGVATNNHEVIGKEAVVILRSFKFSPGDLRGLGVQMTKLEPLKSHPSAPDGSQPKLVFGAPGGAPPTIRRSKHESIDEIRSPEKKSATSREADTLDPITDEPFTPRKPKALPAMALTRASGNDRKATTPLNVSGTQFIIPSNADPETIAELPNDIRSKLMAQKPSARGPSATSRGGTSRQDDDVTGILPSQIDPEVFHALPDEVKAEVLETYGRKPVPQAGQRSPRKGQQSASARRPNSPQKRGPIKSMLNKAPRQSDTGSGRPQADFGVTMAPSEAPYQEVEELDPDFLTELPEDVRMEIIEHHKRQQMTRRTKLPAPVQRQPQNLEPRNALSGQRQILFPPPPPKISFDSSSVTSLPEIKDMLDAWHSETSKEGPHQGDVEVLNKYVRRVIQEERDIEKAVRIIKWLDLLVEQDGIAGNGQGIWRVTMKDIKATAKEAVRQRGLPLLDL